MVTFLVVLVLVALALYCVSKIPSFNALSYERMSLIAVILLVTLTGVLPNYRIQEAKQAPKHKAAKVIPGQAYPASNNQNKIPDIVGSAPSNDKDNSEIDTGTNSEDESSSPSSSIWEKFIKFLSYDELFRACVYFTCILIGMLSFTLAKFVVHRSRLRKSGKSTKNVALHLDDLLFPILLSGCVFAVFWNSTAADKVTVASMTIAYQNGFFFQTLFRLKDFEDIKY